MSETCSKCGKAGVVGCDGRGYLRIDDNLVKPCPNIYVRQLMQHLGPEIAGAPYVSASPLLSLNPAGGRPLVDRTKDNLLIYCPWYGLLAHLKYALAYKGLSYYHRVINDERIKNVFVGGEAYKARSSKVRDDLDTNNSLPDLVSGDYHLVIIKLGYLGYKNQAAPGALKEALLHRESLGLPTWLVLDPNRDWLHSHDPDVGLYVQDRFEKLTLAPVGSRPEPENVGMDSLEEALNREELPQDLEEQIVREAEAPSYEPEPSGDLLGDIALPGEGQPERRKFGGGWKKGRR